MNHRSQRRLQLLCRRLRKGDRHSRLWSQGTRRRSLDSTQPGSGDGCACVKAALTSRRPRLLGCATTTDLGSRLDAAPFGVVLAGERKQQSLVGVFVPRGPREWRTSASPDSDRALSGSPAMKASRQSGACSLGLLGRCYRNATAAAAAAGDCSSRSVVSVSRYRTSVGCA